MRARLRDAVDRDCIPLEGGMQSEESPVWTLGTVGHDWKLIPDGPFLSRYKAAAFLLREFLSAVAIARSRFDSPENVHSSGSLLLSAVPMQGGWQHD